MKKILFIICAMCIGASTYASELPEKETGEQQMITVTMITSTPQWVYLTMLEPVYANSEETGGTVTVTIPRGSKVILAPDFYANGESVNYKTDYWYSPQLGIFYTNEIETTLFNSVTIYHYTIRVIE